MISDPDSVIRDPARLAAVRGLDLLDTPAEEAFDRLARMAARDLNAPVALVTLVDEDRQFFKSCLGLPEPWRSLRQTPLSHSFCKHVVATGEPLNVPDARKHPALRDNAAIADLHVVAYLGIPLVTPDGHIAGSFCVIDSKPRRWTKHHVSVLRDLAELVTTEITLRREVRAHELTEKSLQRARRQLEKRVRKQASQLRFSETRLERLMGSSMIGIIVADFSGKIIQANDTFLRIIGHTHDDLAAEKVRWDRMTPPEYRDQDRAMIQTAIDTGFSPPFEKQYIRKDGSRVPVLLSIVTMLEGSTEECVCFVLDLTERKRTETALGFSKFALDSISNPVFWVDSKGRLLHVNSAACEIMGYSRDELLRMTVPDIDPNFPPEAWPKQWEKIKALRNATIETALKRKDGRILSVELSLNYIEIGGAGYHCALVRDITERKRAERILRESEEQFRRIAENAPFGIGINDAQQRITFINTHFVQLFGYPLDEIPTIAAWAERAYPDPKRRAEIFSTWDRDVGQVRSGKLKQSPVREYEIICRDGSVKQVEITFSLFGDLTYAVFNDVTARRRAEDALKQSQANLSAVVESTEDMIWSMDAKTLRILTFNSALANYLKQTYGVELRQGMTTEDALPANRAPIWKEHYARVLASGRFRVEYPLLEDRGVLELYFNRIEKDGKVVAISVFGKNITERKRAEERLEESRKQLRAFAAHLQTIREEERTRIAREIHDVLGQSLTGIKMDLAWLEKKIRPDQTILLEKIRSISELVNPTIETVRKICSELRPGLLDDLGLAAAVEWQAEEFGRRTGLRTTVKCNAASIHLDGERSTAVFRIFQEALTNVARHSKATRVDVALAQRNGCVELTVQDDGRGISAAERSRTESLGFLGMRERAELFGGEVSISGAPAAGTTVSVRVPLAEPAA